MMSCVAAFTSEISHCRRRSKRLYLHRSLQTNPCQTGIVKEIVISISACKLSQQSFVYSFYNYTLLFFQAIEGLGTLKIGQWNQKMVPVKEMTDVLNVVKDLVQLKAKQWVRMKRGIFKDDLAQVQYVIFILTVQGTAIGFQLSTFILSFSLD
jgi:hypothetical protein